MAQHPDDPQTDEGSPKPETRPDEQEGPDVTPLGQTDVEQDEEGSTEPGD